jgi:predicted DNA-binding transcriptional regulator AlpA
MSANRPRTTRSRKAALTDALGVAEILACTVQAVRTYLAEGKMPAPLQIGSEEQWRVAEIRHWLTEGCPNRRTWENLHYR